MRQRFHPDGIKATKIPLHHVIIRGNERRPIVHEKDRENFVSRLGQLAAEDRKSIEDFIIYRRHTQIDADRLQIKRSALVGVSLRLTEKIRNRVQLIF